MTSVTQLIKSALLKIVSKSLDHPSLQPQLQQKIRHGALSLPKIHDQPHEYFSVANSNKVQQRGDIVFVSSRFRSGSTLLWNLFRQSGLYTAYYEPFNERRWFDKNSRGDGVDNTHRGVDDYWLEYEHLTELAGFYREDWIRHQLLMTETSWDPDMQHFINTMIEKAPKAPLLQFNRTDFRLTWLKHQYPNAKIIHLYRHPRDQWCSFLTDPVTMNKDTVTETYVDGFYLNTWCQDLSQHFPMLCPTQTPHPYQRFYYLWKLSYLYGKTHADYSLSFEALVTDTKNQLQGLFAALGHPDAPIEQLCQLIDAPEQERWRSYADENWFAQHESVCEAELSRWLKGANKEK